MPLYEFRCPNGHDFEKFYRSIGTASSEAVCPVCGAIGARRMSTAGLVFKGSGFYITDYGKDGKKAERDAVTAEKTKADTAAAAAATKAADAKPSEGATSGAGESAPAAKVKTTESAPATSPPASQPASTAPATKSTSSE